MQFLDTARLEMARREAKLCGDVQQALQVLQDEAGRVLSLPVRTVMDKEYTPASGEKHDYFSIGPYWWPNPSTPDGLPYVRRDGEVNPEVEKTDFAAFRALLRDVQTLSLAYFYLDEEDYATDAARRIRAWFLDDATRMNPHLEFAQAIPGVCDGRGIGIIDTTSLCWLPDSMELLKYSAAWSEADHQALQNWLASYLDWLLQSKHAQDEAREHNNHGTWYDAQVATLALACGRPEIARRVLEEVLAKRFALHIADDGSQPHELTRTRSFTYSCFNLLAMFYLSALAPHVGLDLWSWRHSNGASLQKALEFLAAYAGDEKPWPYPQMETDDQSLLFELLHRAPASYQTAEMENARRKAQPHATTWWKTQLLWPI